MSCDCDIRLKEMWELQKQLAKTTKAALVELDERLQKVEVRDNDRFVIYDRFPMFEERRCRGCPQAGVSVYRAEMGYIHLCPDTLDAMLEVMRLSDEVIESEVHESSQEVSDYYQDLADTD